MANRNIFTRVYSEKSAGKLVSGKSQTASLPYPTLSNNALEEEFRNHSSKWNRDPTALVSCSSRIIDTVQRAFEKCHKNHESQKDIWIAFIEVPSTAPRIYHSAQNLAERCNLRDSRKFSYEVVFEWAIPKKYVIHEVSLETLVRRGLQKDYYYKPTVKDVRNCNATDFQQYDLVESGLSIGFFAQVFGVRAPLNWIAHRLFYDCGGTAVVPSRLYDGICVSLNDNWLADLDLFQAYKEYKHERDIIEDAIIWDLIECWETWNVDPDGKTRELSTKEEVSYERAKNKLLAKYEKMRAVIEEEAVKIGL
jgi:hypothetical protein